MVASPPGNAIEVHLTTLCLQNFRNYTALEMEFHSGGALFVGENGAGKTNILEAIYLLCTGRSQRGAARRTMIQRGQSTSCARGVFRSHRGLPTSVHFGFSSDGRLGVEVNDQTANSVSEWFGQHRVVPFGPPDLLIVQGSPSERRRYMNVLLSQVDSEYLHSLVVYKKCLLSRNRLLCDRGGGREIEVYEEQMAQFGAYLMQKRRELFTQIGTRLAEIYAHISNEGEAAAIQYRPSVGGDGESTDDFCRQHLVRLRNRRAADRERSFTSVGPHRDDFLCTVDNGRAAQFASQGQCRSLAISLRLCSLSFLRQHCGDDETMILVDDAFCELDAGRVSRIYPLIRNRGQMFVTSTSAESSYTNGLPRFDVAAGRVRAL